MNIKWCVKGRGRSFNGLVNLSQTQKLPSHHRSSSTLHSSVPFWHLCIPLVDGVFGDLSPMESEKTGTENEEKGPPTFRHSPTFNPIYQSLFNPVTKKNSHGAPPRWIAPWASKATTWRRSLGVDQRSKTKTKQLWYDGSLQLRVFCSSNLPFTPSFQQLTLQVKFRVCLWTNPVMLRAQCQA